jgi:hypothetical protein
MLSATYTVSDVKAKLVNSYDYFGYVSDAAYTAAIESTCEDVMRLYFYPRIGEDDYNTIAAKNRVGLTSYETSLYWAEVYTVAYQLLKWVESYQNQLMTSSSEALTVEGYSYKTSSGTGNSTSSNKALRAYYDKMFSYWALAGWNLSSLQRTCTIWGESDANDYEVTIIE